MSRQRTLASSTEAFSIALRRLHSGAAVPGARHRTQHSIRSPCGSPDNAVVVDHDGPINESGLPSPDEPVRHKILDATGDLAWLGSRIEGRLVADRPGPGLIVKLLRAVMDDPDSRSITDVDA